MIEQLRRNPLIAALALLCVALAVAVAVELATMGGPARASAPRKTAASEAKLLPPIAAVSPEAAYPETAARPLWIPTRRPAPPAVVAQASFQRGQFVLQGVTIAGNTRIAMLKEKASGRVHRVEQGRDLNGLNVAEIEPEKVTLAQGGEREVLVLQVQRPPGAPGAAVGAASAPTAFSAPAVASQGPFGATPSSTTAPRPAAAPTGAASPTQSPMGPISPAGTFSSSTAAPAAANPSPAVVPQQQSASPMTPEELLARRRARRTPSP